MAGLLICPFESARSAFPKCKAIIEANLFLRPSAELDMDSLMLVKYMRSCDEDDSNCQVDDEWSVYCAGTLVHEDADLRGGIKAVLADLKRGKTIDEICTRIDGSFILAVLDRRQRLMYLVTDAVGLFHMYLYYRGGMWVVSSLMNALVRSLPVTPSPKSIAQFMRSSYVLDEDTLFEEIKLLDYASIYCFDLQKGQMQKRRYYHFPRVIDRTITFEEAVGRLSETMGKLLGMFPRKRTLFDFTGGNDSRSLLSYVYRDGRNRNEISVHFSGPEESREYRIVRDSCAKLGIRLYDFPPDEELERKFYDYLLTSHMLSGGDENVAYYAPILWANQKKKDNGFCYSVHGSGGELYRDARWAQEFGRRGTPQSADLERLIRWRVFQYEYDFSIFSGDFLKLIQGVPEQFLDSYKRTVAPIDPRHGTNTLQLDTIYLLQNMRRWGGAKISSTNQIINSVCPFLFRTPLNLTLSLNPSFRKGCRLNKAIAERLSPLLAAQKMHSGSPYMVWKPYRTYRFVPFYFFLTKKLVRKLAQVFWGTTVFSKMTVHDFDVRPRFTRMLESPEGRDLLDFRRMQTREFYNQQGLERFLEKARQPGFKYYKVLGNMMTLELTMRGMISS